MARAWARRKAGGGAAEPCRRGRLSPRAGRPWRLEAAVLALALSLPASSWVAAHAVQPESSVTLPGNPAPDFVLLDDRGAPLRLAGFVDRQPLLLTFWSAACGECLEHLRTPEGTYQRHRAAGLLVLAVNVDRAPVPLLGTALQETARDLGLSFPQLMDPRRTAAAGFGVGRLPTTILIDRRGVIREVVEGTGAWTGGEGGRPAAVKHGEWRERWATIAERDPEVARGEGAERSRKGWIVFAHGSC